MATTAFALSMTCQYCGARNAPDEQRCCRCGRRLQAANPRPAPDGYRPTALALKPLPDPGIPSPAPRQPRLFSGEAAPRVVSIAREPVERKPAPKAKAAPKPAEKRPAQAASRTQQKLAFGPIIPSATAAPTTVDPIRFCKAPVARPEHRALAAFIDGGMIVAAWMILAAMYTLWGGGVWALTPWAIAGYAVAALGVAVFYSLLWALANGESAGLRAARLKILNFDGRPANRRERFARIASAWISIAPGGLGLVWALLDEEALTWHDQISKTFPTPIDAIR